MQKYDIITKPTGCWRFPIIINSEGLTASNASQGYLLSIEYFNIETPPFVMQMVICGIGI